MTLNAVEREFLLRLAHKPWTSPAVFDHSLLQKLAEAKYVTSRAVAQGGVCYEIADLGRAAAIEAQRSPSGARA